MIWTRGTVAKLPTDLKIPSYSPFSPPSPHQVASHAMQSQSPDPSFTRSGRFSPESSPNPSLPSDPTTSCNMTTSRNRKLPSRSGLTSSPESSAVTETVPSSASPAVQPSSIQVLKLQVAAAREKEGRLRTALAETYQRKK